MQLLLLLWQHNSMAASAQQLPLLLLHLVFCPLLL
jgi:hypothetical protein